MIAARAQTAADARRENEYRRLLYVAMTRAADRLIVCGDERRASECRRAAGTISSTQALTHEAAEATERPWRGTVLALSQGSSARRPAPMQSRGAAGGTTAPIADARMAAHDAPRRAASRAR